MPRKILVYGHGDKSAAGFSSAAALKTYIGGGVFQSEDGRYRYSQKKRAEIIILCREGFAFGHFEVDGIESPTAADLEAYPPVKGVYQVRKSTQYSDPVRMTDLDIAQYQYGKYITEEEFDGILRRAGKTEVFCR
jgi:protein-disulfide isomerase-like protein with CxxC motif